MTPMIFVNLPVSDLVKARAFYEALGFTHNPAFSDETGACMVLSETIHVMLLTHAKWQGFTTRPICPVGSSEVSLAITVADRAAGVGRFGIARGQRGYPRAARRRGSASDG